ncbi:unnamed protein product [Meloidogyne enterolobii]|uniref:Uncharacterized protein n=1 Tax=Meloidogyne enterolobii TaxID=390850 RepID=A0ACB0Z9T2_MELEN
MLAFAMLKGWHIPSKDIILLKFISNNKIKKMSLESLDLSGGSSGNSNEMCQDDLYKFSQAAIIDKLHVDEKLALWLSKMTFTDDDPILVLNFSKTVSDADREKVVSELGKHGGEKCPFQDNVFKFETHADLTYAKDALLKIVPKSFYSTIPLCDEKGEPRYDLEPSITTTLIVVGKKKQLQWQHFEFFKIL